MTERFAILTVTGAHGIKGELKANPLMADEAALRLPVCCFAAAAAAPDEPTFMLTSLRPAGRHCLVRLDGVDDRTAAERLRGLTLFAERAAVPPPEAGTWFLSDLTGLAVFEDGDLLGHVKDVVFGPSQDLLVVGKAGAADLYIPAVRNFLRDVDLAAGAVTVKLPDGLLALYRGTGS